MRGVFQAIRLHGCIYKNAVLQCVLVMNPARFESVCSARLDEHGFVSTTISGILKAKDDSIQRWSIDGSKTGEEKAIDGIITKKDYLRKIIVQERSFKSTKVGDIMIKENKPTILTSSLPSSSVEMVSYRCCCDIVAFGVGSLDEMETSLHRLGPPITASLLAQVIDACCKAHAGRRLLRFLSWCRRQSEGLGDQVFNHAIWAFAEMKDLIAMRIAISDLHKDRRRMDPETFVHVVEALIGSGRADEAVRLFWKMEEAKQLPEPHPQCGCGGGNGDWCAVTSVIHALCAKGHVRKARGVAWHHRNVLHHSDTVQRSLLHGWCAHGNAGEARCALQELKLSGVRPGLASYNDLLSCICERNLRFNPSALVPEATDLMLEMRSAGVRPSALSYNILLSCLGRARRVKEACRILLGAGSGSGSGSSSGIDCSPILDWVSYYLVIRVLYLTGKFAKGNSLLDYMLQQGMTPPPRFYRRLIGLLCGMNQVEHAVQLFEGRMKGCCHSADTGPMYDLLIAKLCRSRKSDAGRCFRDDAVKRHIALQCSSQGV